MAEPIALTLTVPAGQSATGVYEDENGVEAYYTDGPYLAANGLQSPMPVFDAGGPVFQDSMGRAQKSLAVNSGIAPITLVDLTGTFTLSEDASIGDIAGTISGKTVGSTLSLIDDDGDRVALDGLDIERGITALTGLGGTTRDFTVRETLIGATNSPHDTVLSYSITAVGPDPTPTEMLDEFTDHNITWNLSAAVPVGQYVSGDYFAVGGEVASASPASEQYDGSYSTGETYADRWVHGAMVNPGRDGGTGANPATTPQGWDSLPKAPSVPSVTEFAYDHAKNLDPGATGNPISGVSSIVKSKSILTAVEANSRTKLSDSSLLTLVDEVPPEGSFRRWAGSTSKVPIFFASDVDWSALPVVTMPVGATLPTAANLIAKLGPIHTYMNQMLYARGTNPINQQAQYGADIANDVQQAILFTMTSGVSEGDRNAVAYRLIQNGLDIFDALEFGRRWSSATFSFGGAHQWLKVLVVYAARLLHNAAGAADLAEWVDGTVRKVFGDDMMVFAIDRTKIESTPYEALNTRIWPAGYPDWSEGSIEWLSKPSSTDSIGLSYEIAYRGTNAYPFMTTALITRLLGAESLWDNPTFFEYVDTYYNKWVRRSKPTDSYFYDFNRRYVDAYFAANSPAYTGSGAPSLVSREANGRYAWIEASEPFDLAHQPAAADLAVTVAGSGVTLTSVSTTASGSQSTGSTNMAQPTITVASATGIRIGQLVECGSLPPDIFVTSVAGTTIGISGTVPANFGAQPITFHNVFVWGRALVAVLPTPLASAGQAVTIGYTSPGSGYIRNLRGTGIGTLSTSAATNRTGLLPDGPASKDLVYSGASNRQYSGTRQPASEAFQRLRMSLRFSLKSALATNENLVTALSASTTTFRLYATSASDLRVLIGGGGNRQMRLPAALTGAPLDTLLTLHLLLDGTATSLATANKAALVWNGGGNTNLSVTGSTGTIDGSWASNIATLFTSGMFAFADGSGANPFHGSISELTVGWGGASYTLPPDLTGPEFAHDADWGDNGEGPWGQNQLYYAGTVDEWNAGLLNRGSGGALSMSPRRVTEDGELITPYVIL